ncbi:MAG: hypothetical protein ACI9YH_001921 [Colwellia sp.]|jgi:hypothetical protein
MGSHKPNKTFIEIISMPNINNFSAIEIRTAYIALTKDELLVPAEVRRLVYEELLKLERKGWIEKTTSNKRKISRYSKTNSFTLMKKSEPIHIKSIKEEVASNPIKKELLLKINQYKKELVEGLGSLEECLTLRNIYPELYKVLKTKHDALKEKNHMLIGKLKVLNDLTNPHEESNK